jgi:Stage II sporulation protein M
MASNNLVLVDGMRRTRAALERWRAEPWPTLRGWFAGSLVVATMLLIATWVVAVVGRAEPSDYDVTSLESAGTLGDVGFLLERNGLVLALHALACVAGFIARSSLPLQAERYAGTWRRLHDTIGTAALGFVGAATLLSLGTQALALGRATSAYAAALDVSPALFLASRLVHALPELVALFLPLAAWLITSRRGAWQDLLAVTFVTVAIAVPILVGAAVVEVYISPHIVP